MPEQVKVIIVGAGPAGIAAAIYLRRAGWDPLVLEEGRQGGLLREANLVENYPGFPEGVKGAELADLMEEQADNLGIKFERSRATRIASEGGSFCVETETTTFTSDILVVATGTVPKKTAIVGQDKVGANVHYGISSLLPVLSQGMRVVVLGGGDAAFDYAINISDRRCAAHVVSRSAPTCLQLLRDRAVERGITVLEGYEPVRIGPLPNGVVLSLAHDGGQLDIECDHIVIAHGREPRVESLEDELKSSIAQAVDSCPRTNLSGLFAVGDVVRGLNRQAAIAVGDGVRAAMMIDEILKQGGVDR